MCDYLYIRNYVQAYVREDIVLRVLEPQVHPLMFFFSHTPLLPTAKKKKTHTLTEAKTNKKGSSFSVLTKEKRHQTNETIREEKEKSELEDMDPFLQEN